MEKSHKAHIVLRLIFLTIGLQLLSVLASVHFGRTVNEQRVLFIFFFILVWILMIFLLRKYPQVIATKTFIALIVLIYALVYGGLFKMGSGSSAKPITGNNQATMSYTKDFFAKGYDNIEDALKKGKASSSRYKEIYRFENKDSACVIYYAPAPKSVKKGSVQAKNPFYVCPKLESAEMYKKDGKYYYIGKRNLTCSFSKKHSDEDTLRSDLQESLKKRSTFPEFQTVYAWGCSAYPHMERISIAGQKCRKVIPLTMDDGSKLYFWLVDGIKVKTDPATVTIEGMD